MTTEATTAPTQPATTASERGLLLFVLALVLSGVAGMFLMAG